MSKNTVGPVPCCFQHITVSNTLLSSAMYCFKQYIVSTHAFNIQLSYHASLYIDL